MNTEQYLAEIKKRYKGWRQERIKDLQEYRTHTETLRKSLDSQEEFFEEIFTYIDDYIDELRAIDA